jgi:23S rRNA (adenine-N6)-dimethyltransferase
VAGPAGRWGWHQLDRRWIARLIRAAELAPGDLVLDIGAGTGAITDQLVRAGASVLAIELHAHRASVLRNRFADWPVTVAQLDATELRLPKRPFKVVANPPFGITTAQLRRLTQPASRLQRASLVLPAWAAKRWAAGRGVGGVTSKFAFTFTLGPKIPAAAFYPAPPADAAILLITRNEPPR